MISTMLVMLIVSLLVAVAGIELRDRYHTHQLIQLRLAGKRRS